VRLADAGEMSQEAGDAVEADAPPAALPSNGELVRAETGAKPGSRGQEVLSYASASSTMPPPAPGDSSWK
jgi:hypothetical protein